MRRRSFLIGTGALHAWSRGFASRLLGSPAAVGTVEDSAAAPQASPKSSDSGEGAARDIRKLTQHFTGESEDISPWMFTPKENVKSVSTSEHPGFVTIWHGDKGQDIKGLLAHPIRIDDFPIPWEFHLGFGQLQSSEQPRQSCYGMGLNLAFTFSDPSTWPSDGNQLPPDTHTFQLFVVHLRGSQIKPGPMNYYAPVSEHFLLFGRGDLDPNVMGDWKVPYLWEGYSTGGLWNHTGGPSSHTICFRLKLISPTKLEVGFFGGLQGEPHPGWRMKTIDVSRYGTITGIWEIGPVISLDRWLPDVLVPALGLSSTPPLETSDPEHMYYMVDYAAFFGTGPENLDHMSDDFEMPGFQAKWYHEGGAIVEDYSHPGQLAITLLSQGTGAWAMCPTNIGSTIVDLTKMDHFPGYEVEVGFTAPEDIFAWNFYMSSLTVWDENGNKVGTGMPHEDPGIWHVGVQYYPREKRHRFINIDAGPLEHKKGPMINVEFEPDVPESILSHRPLYMLVQILDASHLRVGFRAKQTEPWYLSKVFDTTKSFGKIGKFNPHTCFTGSVSNGKVRGWGIGNYPRYPRFLVDYVNFRYGLSTQKT
jgi:hypothetical protein